MAKKRINEQPYIFSGDDSRTLWKDINRVSKHNRKDEDIHSALYHLGCKCQELEAIVRRLVEKQEGALND